MVAGAVVTCSSKVPAPALVPDRLDVKCDGYALRELLASRSREVTRGCS